VEDDERGNRDTEDPEELVAVTGAEDRVRRYSRGIVVGETGEEAGTEDGEEGGEPEP
jgi:hypothetical protein